MKMMNENFHLMILYKYIKYFLIKIYYFTLILRIPNSYIYYKYLLFFYYFNIYLIPKYSILNYTNKFQFIFTLLIK